MGTTSSFFGGGGGSPLPEPEWLFRKSSYTYTFPYDGVVLVHVIGAGGSGACQYNQYGATGGGAGGYSRKQFTVTSSTTATVTTGVGGNYVGPGSTYVNGNAGTNSTFVLGSDTLTANGGGAGQWGGSGTTTGTGGTASGGDVNYTGGDGGTRGYTYNDQVTIATGGGAVNLFGLASGEVNGGNNNTSKSGPFKATGGGGVGGHGGNIDANMVYVSTGGGGSAGPAFDMPSSFNNVGHQQQRSSGGAGGARLFRFGGPFLDGVGGVAINLYYSSTPGWERNITATIGMGAGSGGCATNTDNDSPTVNGCQQAGIFGGGGGLVTGQAYGGNAGDAVVGGGGGAATYYTASSSQSNIGRRSGQGGDGVVIIEYIERT